MLIHLGNQANFPIIGLVLTGLTHKLRFCRSRWRLLASDLADNQRFTRIDLFIDDSWDR